MPLSAKDLGVIIINLTETFSEDKDEAYRRANMQQVCELLKEHGISVHDFFFNTFEGKYAEQCLEYQFSD